MDIATIIQYIKELPSDEISLENVAKKFNYNPSYFSRKFREETGVSFRKYTESLKIQRGKQKLLQSDNSVTEISYDSGFEYSNNFTSSFKKHTGINPKSYKKESYKYYKVLNNMIDIIGTYKYYSTKEISSNSIEIDLLYPEKYNNAINFVGIFNQPIPNGVPIVGIATKSNTKIIMDHIPSGEYYLLACDIDKNVSFFKTFEMEDNYRGKFETSLKFESNDFYKITIVMRKPLPEDPAITVNLPKLLFEYFKNR